MLRAVKAFAPLTANVSAPLVPVTVSSPPEPASASIAEKFMPAIDPAFAPVRAIVSPLPVP